MWCLSTKLIRIVVCLGDASASQKSAEGAKAGQGASKDLSNSIIDGLLASIETRIQQSNEILRKSETAKSENMTKLKRHLESEKRILDEMKAGLHILRSTNIADRSVKTNADDKFPKPANSCPSVANDYVDDKTVRI